VSAAWRSLPFYRPYAEEVSALMAKLGIHVEAQNRNSKKKSSSSFQSSSDFVDVRRRGAADIEVATWSVLAVASEITFT
jgi:hypothetical protein